MPLFKNFSNAFFDCFTYNIAQITKEVKRKKIKFLPFLLLIKLKTKTSTIGRDFCF